MKLTSPHGTRLLPVLAMFALAGAPVPSFSQTTAAPGAAPRATARPDTAFELTVENIMRGPLLVGRSPNEVRWSEDSRYVYFRWREPESADTATSVYRVAAGGGEPERLADSVAARAAPAVRGSWSADRRWRAVEREGDIFVVDARGGERRITATPVRERSPHLSPDGSTVYYLSGSNVFAVAVAGGPLRQLTDIRTTAGPAEKPKQDQAVFLEEQQKELFGAIRDRAAERERRAALDSARVQVKPLYLGKDASLSSAEVSPSGRFVLLGVDDNVEPKRTIVPNYVTESGYTEDLVVRSKVGDVQDGRRAGILDLAAGTVAWIAPAPAEREATMVPVGWAPRTDRALLIGISGDYENRWIYSADPAGNVATLEELHDEAWVAGPGFFTAGWLPDGSRAYFVSERTGYAHLYTAPAAGGPLQAMTSGEWEVTDVQLAPDGRSFHLTTSEVGPGERHLYSLPVGGGEMRRLTALAGWNESLVSPDGRSIAILHSQPNRPPELYLERLAPGDAARQVTLSTTAEFRSGPWIQPEIIRFPARDGEMVHANIYRPSDFGAEPNGAAVVFVHGAGYLQNVHKGWSNYFREYMFHHLLASRGYTVLDVDYRGSAGYGRDWRTGIYRHMGGKDLSDQVDGVRYLVQNEGVDPERVGIYGGSYGGFITLMALFTEPDVFRSGAALRSVTDWAHYNQGYTSRILNEPQEDPDAYRRSSPIYFAEGLEGDLLIAHGMVDTNVHFQDVVRLAQRLIELGKTNWEMAVYPVEDHGFVRPDSWTDEYRRILELFDRTLLGPGSPAATQQP